MTTGSFQARSSRVSGIVNGAGSKPMQGVSVLVKGSRTGTTTDENGAFTIAVPGGGIPGAVIICVRFNGGKPVVGAKVKGLTTAFRSL